MIRFWFEKRWVQILSLLAFFAGMVFYWGWVFDFGYTFDWSVLYTKNATYGQIFGLELLKGVKITVVISLVSAALALFLGIFFGLGRLSKFRPMSWISTAYVEFFRNTPLLVQLFFWYFAFPMGLPEAARDWVFSLGFEFLGVTMGFEFWSATIGLGMYTGSFMAEVIRAGLQSINKGLLEAAYSSGLNYVQVLTRVILPIAFRNIIPPLGSEFLNNMKNSSLAMVVGVAELCWQAQQVESLTFKGFEATTAATFLYLVLSLVISFVMNRINMRMKVESMALRAHKRAEGGPLTRMLSRLTLLRLHRRRSQGSALSYSRTRAAWIAFFKKCWWAFSWALKILFLVALAGLLLKALWGLYNFNWQVVADNIRLLLIWRFPNGTPNELFWGLGGLSYSILMSVIAISVSFFIGLVMGLGRTSSNLLFRIPATIYIECIRGVPLIMVIFWIYFFIPVLFNTFFDVFWSATIALTVFTGAYIAEIVRAGIENIPAGQFEAAYSTGLSYFQTMRRVILPQALKQMIPAIVGQFIAIFKDTSLAYVIGVLELTFVAQGLNNRLMVYPFEIYTTVATLYFGCCYLMSIVANRLERKLSPERINLEM
jgi:polar amino acid transport system permease protein